MKRIILFTFTILIFTNCSSQQNDGKMDFESEYQKALDFMDKEEYAKAEKILLKLDERLPEAIGIKMNLSIIEEQKGNKEKAIKYLEDALVISPNHPPLVRLLGELTGDDEYEKKAAALKNKIVEVSSEQYFKDFQEEHPIVNSEYAVFDIRIKGEVVLIDKEEKIIYLKGEDKTKEKSVICSNVSAIIEEVKEGEIIEFIGFSFGIGEDLSEPIIVFKRKH